MSTWILLILIGLLAGAFSAMLGLGSGSILIPALVLLLYLPQKSAQGISLAVMVPMALVGAVRYYLHPEILVPLDKVLVLSVFAVIGAFFGAKLAFILPVHVLQKIFAIVLIILGARMFFISNKNRDSNKDKPSISAQASQNYSQQKQE